METRILEQKENSIVGRKEIKFELTYEHVPPKRAEALKAVANAAKTNPEFTIIKKMNNCFGIRRMVGTANAYPNEASTKQFETKNILKRNKFGEKAEAPIEKNEAKGEA